jgi:outer membrane receptor for ferrienterochelin and colicins
MNPPVRSFIAALLANAALLLFVCAQGVIVGTVADEETRRPLPGANVFLQGTVIGTVTDADGRFRIPNVPQQRVTLAVSMMGYERFVREDIFVGEGETVSFGILLRTTVIETAPVVVTATRTERSLREVPASVSVLGAREIERRNVLSIEEALRTVPGVHFNMSQINIRGSSGYSHGAGSRVMLMVDGVPMLAGDTGEITWELVPVELVERVEVVKGAGSALYGSGALGGVVNIITRDLPGGEGAAAHSFMRVQGGMYDRPGHASWRWTDRSRFRHQVQFGELRLMGSIAALYDDGYRQNDSRRRTSGSLKGRYTLSSRETLTLTGFFLDQVRRNFLYWKSLDEALVPSDRQLGEEVESFRLQSTLQYLRVLGAESFVTVRGSLYHTDWSDNIEGTGNASRANVWGLETQFNHVVARSHYLVGGIETSVQTVRSDVFGARTGYVFAAFAQDEWQLPIPLRISGGIRFDVTRLDTIDTFMSASPRFGMSYTLAPGATLRASAGAGFRAPAAAEAFARTAASGLILEPNPGLDAERSWSFETGVNADLASWLNVDAALYRTEYRDMIEPVASIDPATSDITARFVNVVRARVQGFETGVAASLFGRAVQPRIAWTLMHSRDLDLDEPLKYRHRHMITGGILLRRGAGWFEADYRYMSKMEKIDAELDFIIDRADARVPVHVVDIAAGVDARFGGIPLRLSAGVKNLLQYYYVEFVANVQPIRQYVASVRIIL